ncbi:MULTISPECIES: alkyl hydroperoxide reductase subunit F [Alteromonadaceae]|jgi:alkyl hydroperoxide reductase subunit F|uniref:Alkyl hydroperoxide reductase subunit F n=1 Tax=Brumicola blandensis TaxID=3075611 RepID=A0AAW8R1B9_9ALTE|nr:MULTISPECIES: alkyl hydroperoxide reductase subunit F [unclassified Alteromonas]MDT0583061.1 alkyl hydroperoxide reductase subunit F [Alteromonas sp. W409]MDT0627366.1 alkyl hydroperoxide reductase subunit F [Alteromonas sp. W364]
MLTKDILNALAQYTKDMQHKVTLVLQTGEHSKRSELKDMLSQFASISDKITLEERDDSERFRSPVTFGLDVDGKPTGIVFSGVPGGHEFNSFVLAVLQSGGVKLKLDESIQKMIKKVVNPLKFQVFVSLSCHACPDVVQAMNQFALLNDNIEAEMIDGSVYPDLIEEKGIQGVPTVYMNGEVFATGQIDTAKLIDKLGETQAEMFQASNDVEQLPLQDVTVIGGGPAGVAAAIYSARKGLNVTIVADRFGGQVKDTMGIENLISVPKTTGPELTNSLMDHLNDYEVNVREHLRVDSIEKGDIKKLTLTSGEVVETKTIIIATGANWRELGVPGEKENIGNGVAYCPHCDGPFYKGKDVAVIGGGNSGVEAALDLAGIVKSVTVFEFLPELKADQVLIDQINARDNISVIKNAQTKEILAADGKVNAIEYIDRDTSEVHQKELQGVFVQIGLVPNSSILKGIVDLTKYGEVIINEKGQTSEEGIFACGDVTTVPYKQIVIAMGEGAKASLAAYDHILMSKPAVKADSAAA